MTRHPRLVSPLNLRDHTLRNRIVFDAHTANMSDQGLPGPRFGQYLLERALGGAAMVVAEPVRVHRTGVLTRGNFLHSDDAAPPPALRPITDKVKAGAIILRQLCHIGAHGDPEPGLAAHGSPSGGPSHHESDGSHAMTAASGFQGVAVRAACHSLLDQFWTARSNLRTDRCGGRKRWGRGC